MHTVTDLVQVMFLYLEYFEGGLDEFVVPQNVGETTEQLTQVVVRLLSDWLSGCVEFGQQVLSVFLQQTLVLPSLLLALHRVQVDGEHIVTDTLKQSTPVNSDLRLIRMYLPPSFRNHQSTVVEERFRGEN